MRQSTRKKTSVGGRTAVMSNRNGGRVIPIVEQLRLLTGYQK